MALGQLVDDAHHAVPIATEHGNEQPVMNASGVQRLPVSKLTVVLAMARLRVTQVLRNRRSLLGTLILPILLCVLNAWSTSSALNNAVGGNKHNTNFKTIVAILGCSSGMSLSVSLAIALPWFVTSVVLDRVSRCTHVAVSQGVPLSAFWLGTFITNYLQLLVIALAIPVLQVVFNTYFYSDTQQLIPIFVAALLAPLAMLMFGYNASSWFNTAEGSSKFMPVVSLLCSIIPFFAVYIMTLLSFPSQITGAQMDPPNQGMIDSGKSLHEWAVIIHIVVSLTNPYYVLPGTFLSIGLSQLPTRFPHVNPDGSLDFTEIEVLPPKLFGSYAAIPILGSVFVSVLLALNLVRDRCCRRRADVGTSDASSTFAGEEGVDSDVAQEKVRADVADPSTQALLYKNLRHTYGSGTNAVHAVRGISIGIAQGECFTLLGPNGAGKTTTLDVMTGAIPSPTAGYVYISGHEVTGDKKSRLKAFKNLGHCPQVDPLWPALSGRQHIQFYARVKGVPSHLVNTQVNMILAALGFNDFDANKSSLSYSGGMKRKLSLAIALIGNPPLLLLDEPSAAVDAAAKRHLWRIVKARGGGQTVLLTTHSMEEAEALSDRLAIQVRGRLRCVGTPDHIKQTHGAGYQLELIFPARPAADRPDPNVLAFVSGFAKNHKLVEYHADRYLFQLPTLRAVGAGPGELTPSRIFLQMHGVEAQEELGLQDFSLSRPSLEQVFLRFAKEQMDHDAES